MATVKWIGAAQTTPQVDTVTITANNVATTYQVTINGKTVSVIGQASTALTATALQAATDASTEPEFAELTWGAVNGSAFTVTGPSDGSPFTMSASVTGGTGTISRTTTTTAGGPNDVSLAANYSTGSLPGAGDDLVLELSDVSLLYNLDALSAIDLGSFTRRSSFTGRVGLSDVSAGGYREYRGKELQVDSESITIETPGSDGAGQVRILSLSSAAVTLSVLGDGSAGGLGSEPVSIRGLPASSVVSVTGGGLAVATAAGDVATIATLSVIGGSVRLGSGVTLTTATLRDADARFDCSCTTLGVDGNGTITVLGNAAVTTLTVDGGTIDWRSTGSPGAITIGSGGAITYSRAPASVAITSATIHPGGVWSDPAGRVTRPYSLVISRGSISEVSLDVGVGRTLQVS